MTWSKRLTNDYMELMKHHSLSKQGSSSRSVRDIFRGTSSTCDQNTTQHLPRPLMKLMTLALLQHTAVLSIAGKGMASTLVLSQDKRSLVESAILRVLCVSWLGSAGHSFHGARSQQRVCLKGVGVVFGTRALTL